MMRNVRRQQVKQSRKMRQLVFMTIGVLLLVYLTFTMIFGKNGLLRYMELTSAKDKLLAETMAIDKQNNDIKGEIETLKKEPELVEELAREYGLTKEGELIFKFDDKE